MSAQGDAISRQAQSCSTVPLRRRKSNPNFYKALSPDIKRRGEHLVIILLKEDTVVPFQRSEARLIPTETCAPCTCAR